MTKNRTIAERKDAAQKRLSKIAGIETLAAPDIQAQYEALHMLAEAKIKSMSVEDAHKWASKFIEEHPEAEAAQWAWRMVGQVEAHQENQRGPKAGSAAAQVSDSCAKVVRTAARLERFGSKSLSKGEIDKLQRRVISICDSQAIPHFDRQQIKQALKQIFTD